MGSFTVILIICWVFILWLFRIYCSSYPILNWGFYYLSIKLGFFHSISLNFTCVFHSISLNFTWVFHSISLNFTWVLRTPSTKHGVYINYIQIWVYISYSLKWGS